MIQDRNNNDFLEFKRFELVYVQKRQILLNIFKSYTYVLLGWTVDIYTIRIYISSRPFKIMINNLSLIINNIIFNSEGLIYTDIIHT